VVPHLVGERLDAGADPETAFREDSDCWVIPSSAATSVSDAARGESKYPRS